MKVQCEVVEDEDLQVVINRVSRYIENGYQCVGGIEIYQNDRGYSVYVQAVLKVTE